MRERSQPAAGVPILVVGAGVAGLATALAAAPRPVVLACRNRGGVGSASVLAQGGIAAAVGPGDRPRLHALDTLEAGARHNAATAVDWLCAQAPEALAWLQGQGVVFDQAADGSLSLGREGGHRTSRIVHAGGDATGAVMVRALQARARAATHISWREGVDVEALKLRGDRVCGARLRDADGSLHDMDASAVVLATGGVGALFARTSNPPGADGSGLALALAADARLKDMEFVQFHPTALDVHGERLPLLTEALRGAGAVLRDRHGGLLMRGVHPLVDLAPRDVVARRVFQSQKQGPVYLDARGVAGDWTRRFPTVLASCLAHGLDPRQDLLPITAAAHYHMGGVAVDGRDATSRPGLFAVGEVACTGVHGANRLASNSLLEAVACGRRLGANLAQTGPVPARGVARTCERGPSLGMAALVHLRELLWSDAGPERHACALLRAIAECARLQSAGWQARVALAILQAALARSTSLGAHLRSDDTTSMRRRMAVET